MLNPFLPWVGSKRKLVEPIVEKLLVHRQSASTYIEPFLGSGAVALTMPAGMPMILGDACKPLGYLWWWIQREPEAIAEYARGFGLVPGDNWNTDDGYIAVRYDHNCEPFSTEDWCPSARFLWLMHACFNGVYRENRQGYMNVPHGDRKRLNIPTPAELRAVADHIVNAEVIVGDFEPMFDAARTGDLVYFDPPYDYGGKTPTYTGYVKEGFRPDDQHRLAEAFWRATQHGAYCLGSNADTDRIRSLYGAGVITAVDEDWKVAADSDKRGLAACVLVENRG